MDKRTYPNFPLILLLSCLVFYSHKAMTGTAEYISSFDESLLIRPFVVNPYSLVNALGLEFLLSIYENNAWN